MTEYSHQKCPLDGCSSSDAFSWNSETGYYYCHSCGGSGGGMFTYGKITPKRQHKEEEGMTLEPYVPEEGYRGISKDTLEKFGVYFTSYGGKETVHYIYNENTTKHRELPKTIRVSGKLDCFYGQQDYNGSGRNITITEGEEDRLSVIEMMGNYPCVSVPGATPSKAFWENARAYLSGFEKIILSVDNDTPGNKLAEDFYRLFPGKVYRVSHTRYKDANEFLTSGAKQEFKSAWWNAAPIKPENILCTREDFHKLYDETPDYEYFPTSIPELDKKMLGIHKGAFTLILAETGIGKCLHPDQGVMMWDGSFKKAKDVVSGDKLMGDDSTPRNVTGTTVGRQEMFKVTPVKGDSWVCNRSHVLSVVNTKTGAYFDISVENYLKQNKTFQKNCKLYRKGVYEFGYNPTKQHNFDPYLVGAYLGDGHTHRAALSLGPKKSKVKTYVEKALKATGHTTKQEDKGSYTELSFKGGDFWSYIRDYVSGDRKIPSEYKFDNKVYREYLLAGILDTDGSVASGCVEIVQKSKTFAEDIAFVSRSLGFAAYVKPKKGIIKSRNFEGDYYRVVISGDLSNLPFMRLEVKPRKQIKDVLRTGFTLESLGEGDYAGFQLDGNHRFLLDDFTVTHNTEVFRYLEWQCLNKTKYSLAVCHGEETPLRSLLGLVSYDLETNVTRKDLIDAGGYEQQVRDSIDAITREERFYQFKIRVDEGVDDIVDQVRFLATAFDVDYIFLEPIQDFVSAVSTSEKESLLTDLTNKLKRLAPELNVGIVVIAHANKEGEAKYCASIVQGAAYEIRLQRDVDAEDEDERNTTHVYVGRKNRTGGGSGPAGALTFDKETYMLTPVIDDSPVFDNTPSGSRDIGF